MALVLNYPATVTVEDLAGRVMDPDLPARGTPLHYVVTSVVCDGQRTQARLRPMTDDDDPYVIKDPFGQWRLGPRPEEATP